MARKAREAGQQGAPASVKSFLKRAWHFLWYEDSLASWIANIVVAFVLIKFVLYPGLGLVLGTQFPVVAVVSSSMEHNPSDFDEWWVSKPEAPPRSLPCGTTSEDAYLRLNITKAEFRAYPFRSGFNKGDIMVLRGVDPETVEKGTVLVYWSGMPYPIIHRYVADNADERTGRSYFVTKGDNNCNIHSSSLLDEYHVPPERVLGQAFLRIPYLGWVKIIAVNAFSCTFQGAGDQGFGRCVLDGPGR